MQDKNVIRFLVGLTFGAMIWALALAAMALIESAEAVDDFAPEPTDAFYVLSHSVERCDATGTYRLSVTFNVPPLFEETDGTRHGVSIFLWQQPPAFRIWWHDPDAGPRIVVGLPRHPREAVIRQLPFGGDIRYAPFKVRGNTLTLTVTAEMLWGVLCGFYEISPYENGATVEQGIDVLRRPKGRVMAGCGDGPPAPTTSPASKSKAATWGAVKKTFQR